MWIGEGRWIILWIDRTRSHNLTKHGKMQMDLEDVVVTSAKSGLGVQHILPVRTRV